MCKLWGRNPNMGLKMTGMDWEADRTREKNRKGRGRREGDRERNWQKRRREIRKGGEKEK